MKTILSIDAYGITPKELFELREPIKNYPREHFFNQLPEWCVREDNGFLDYTEYYHQFTGMFDGSEDKVFVMFDAQPINALLAEEISNVGMEEFFKGIDLRPLFLKFPLNQRAKYIPTTTHLIFDLTYEGSYDDAELFVTLDGYLNENLNKCKIR